MFLAVLTLSASLLGHLPRPPHSITLPFLTPAERAGDWRLKVREDRFTGARTCVVTSPFAQVRRHTVIFRLGRQVSTGDADFRIDDGPAYRVRDVRLDNLRDGFSGKSGPIENPSAGEVGLPVTLIAGADHVHIRPRPGKPGLRRFEVAGLTEILAKAQAAGCAPAQIR